MRSALKNLGVLLATCVPLVAAATTVEPAPSTQERAQSRAWESQVVQRLTEQGTADTLTTAAAMLPVFPAVYDGSLTESQRKSATNKLATERLQLLDRAAAAAPHAADIAAMALQVCTSAPGCDVADHAERLHRAAPDDAGYLLPALADAQSRQDNDKVSAILQSMAAAKTFNSWFPAMRKRLQRGIDAIAVPAFPATAIQDHPDLPDPASFASAGAFAMLTAIGMPSYGTLGRVCRNKAPEFSARQDACRQIGMLLSRDSSLIATQFGLVLWRRSALDKADLETAENASRELEWQQQSWTEVILKDKADPLESYRAMLDNGGEIPGVIALLKKHGIATQPPAGWVSRAERWRQKEHAQTDSAPPSEVCSGTP